MKITERILTVIALLTMFNSVARPDPLGTAFTYQGRLSDGGAPANGIYDFRFTVYDAGANGNTVSVVLTNAATPVGNGFFVAPLDFGANLFDGNARWLEIGVRTNGSSVGFIILAPRQALTPVPYALYAPNAGTASSLSGALPATQLSGTLPEARLSTNVARLDTDQAFTASNTFAGVIRATNENNALVGTFTGHGAGLTNLNASTLTSGTIPLAQLPGAVVTNDAYGVTLKGAFSGNGTGLTNLNASQLSSGRLADTRLSPNVALLNTNQIFTGSNWFTNAANDFAGIFSGSFFGSYTGNGAAVTNLNPANLAGGMVADALLSPNVALLNANQVFTGFNLFTNIDNSFTGGFTGGFAGNGAWLTNLDASDLATGTVPDARLSTSVALLNRSQTFSGANQFTNNANAFAGNGAGLTDLDAAELASGTLPDARLATNVARLGSAQTFTGLKDFSPGGATPFTVGAGKTNVVTNLNAELVGGKRVTDLAATTHTHSYDDLTRGTINDGSLSSNVARLNIAQTITGMHVFRPGVGVTPFSVDASKNGTVDFLNADLLDGYHSSSLLRLAENSTVSGLTAFTPKSGTVPFTVGAGRTNVVLNLNAEFLDGKRASDLALGSHSHFGADWSGTGAIGLDVSTFASTGTGVRGVNTSASGQNWGVKGEAEGEEGRGVAGNASSTIGMNYGGKFSASGDQGRAVYGDADNTGNCVNYGGKFLARGDSGYGIYAEANSTAAEVNYGGMFLAKGQQGVGVRGVADYSATATNYGGMFSAAGTYGRGVRGEAYGSDAIGGYFAAGGNYVSGVYHGVGVYGRASGGYGAYFEADGVGAFAQNTRYATKVSLAGQDYAVKVEGDLVVTNGAIRGDVGPNKGAPFPRPAYDSGWRSVAPNQTLTLTHNLGGDPDDYVISVQSRKSTSGLRYIQGHVYYYDSMLNTIGVEVRAENDSNTEIKVVHGGDAWIDQVRVRLWLVK